MTQAICEWLGANPHIGCTLSPGKVEFFIVVCGKKKFINALEAV